MRGSTRHALEGTAAARDQLGQFAREAETISLINSFWLRSGLKRAVPKDYAHPSTGGASKDCVESNPSVCVVPKGHVQHDPSVYSETAFNT